ncbi:MAG: hypothetical protein M1817_000812 [Caeruleum heppii]|nr:MAG: hypothetical protein M1817_000812 [Caeruleum heppii]
MTVGSSAHRPDHPFDFDPDVWHMRQYFTGIRDMPLGELCPSYIPKELAYEELIFIFLHAMKTDHNEEEMFCSCGFEGHVVRGFPLFLNYVETFSNFLPTWWSPETRKECEALVSERFDLDEDE